VCRRARPDIFSSTVNSSFRNPTRAKASNSQLLVEPDDVALLGNGSDVTRVVLRVADEYGNTQQFSSGAVSLTIEGPGEIIGENPFGLVGGAGAIWIKTNPKPE